MLEQLNKFVSGLKVELQEILNSLRAALRGSNPHTCAGHNEYTGVVLKQTRSTWLFHLFNTTEHIYVSCIEDG